MTIIKHLALIVGVSLFCGYVSAAKDENPVVKIKFTDAFELRKLPNGDYSVNLTINDATVYVELPKEGYDYMRKFIKRMEPFKSGSTDTHPSPGVVYAISKEFDIQNAYGVKTHEVGYRLVGIHEIVAMHKPATYSW